MDTVDCEILFYLLYSLHWTYNPHERRKGSLLDTTVNTVHIWKSAIKKFKNPLKLLWVEQFLIYFFIRFSIKFTILRAESGYVGVSGRDLNLWPLEASFVASCYQPSSRHWSLTSSVDPPLAAYSRVVIMRPQKLSAAFRPQAIPQFLASQVLLGLQERVHPPGQP